MQSRNCRRKMLFRVTDGNRRALQAVRCCSGIGPCMTRGEGQTQKVIRRLLQQVLATGSSTTLCFLVSFRSASSAATVVLLLAAVAVLHWRVLVASCSRSGVSPAVAALDGLRRGPAAACSRRPSSPSAGLGAGPGRRRPALAGGRRFMSAWTTATKRALLCRFWLPRPSRSRRLQTPKLHGLQRGGSGIGRSLQFHLRRF